MVNAKSEYFMAQSLRLYWLLDSVAPIFSFVALLAMDKKKTIHANKLKNSCGQPQTIGLRVCARTRAHIMKKRRTKAKIIITIKMVRCITIVIISIVVCLFWAQRPFHWIFSISWSQPGFYFTFDVLLLVVAFFLLLPTALTQQMSLFTNAELHEIKGNLFLMHDAVFFSCAHSLLWPTCFTLLFFLFEVK